MSTMTTYEIYFHGLICFYSEEKRFGARDKKTEALIVIEDQYHTREIKTYTGTYGTKFSEIAFSLGSAVATASARFQEYVPHLGDLGVTRRDVEIEPDQAISLSLPKSSLDVAFLYDCKGDFELDRYTSVRPVAKLSLLFIRTSDPLKISYTDKNGSFNTDVPRAHPWALIFNGAPDGDASACYEHHFRHYAKISKEGYEEDFATVKQSSYQSAPDSRGRWLDEVLKALAADYRPLNQPGCSNSQWP
jgi:hypothetical protein